MRIGEMLVGLGDVDMVGVNNDEPSCSLVVHIWTRTRHRAGVFGL